MHTRKYTKSLCFSCTSSVDYTCTYDDTLLCSQANTDALIFVFNKKIPKKTCILLPKKKSYTRILLSSFYTLAHYRLPWKDIAIETAYLFPTLVHENCFRGVEVIVTITGLQYNTLLLMLNLTSSFHTHSLFCTHSIFYKIIMSV